MTMLTRRVLCYRERTWLIRASACDTDIMDETWLTPFRGPTSVAIDGWRILVQRGLPQTFDAYCSKARLIETFDLKHPDGDL
jgi:hypothetical protein